VQVDSWVAYGTIEADCGEAIKEVLRNPLWCALKLLLYQALSF
jgi:hypothetical protein